MKEEEKPAEPLVLGAELECEYGSQRSFLMVETDGISINDLPKACVEDSIAHRNIHPFGKCLKNDECYFKMDLEERWVNAEPQTEGKWEGNHNNQLHAHLQSVGNGNPGGHIRPGWEVCAVSTIPEKYGA